MGENGFYDGLGWLQSYPGVTPTEIKKAYITVSLCFYGADERNRTSDPHITNVLLYRLSYIGINPILYSEIRCLATSLSPRGAIKSDAASSSFSVIMQPSPCKSPLRDASLLIAPFIP